MKEGCIRDICVNLHCKGNPNFKAPASDQELLAQALQLWRSVQVEGKHEYWTVVCDPKGMKNTGHSVQKENLESVRDLGFLLEFVQSPYAFSLSFLKDPALVGR